MNNLNLKEELMNKYLERQREKLKEDMSKIEVNGEVLTLVEAGRLIKERLLKYQEYRENTCPKCGYKKEVKQVKNRGKTKS